MSDFDPNQQSAIRDGALRAMASLPERYGRYLVRGELGRGGMGIVYDAFDPQLDRPVALKVLYPDALAESENRDEFWARFLAEMRATSRLFHTNLVSILDAGVENDVSESTPSSTPSSIPSSTPSSTPYYVMERIDGVSLAERLEDETVVTREEGLRIAVAIARGLTAVHGQGLVHRDLKPSNVLLPEQAEPKVADFGLCHSNEVAGVAGNSEQIVGSAHYLAPEQVRCEGVTPRADLFALGAIVLRMFAGIDPFCAPSLAAHMERVLRDEPDGLDALDEDIRVLVIELMSKDPQNRPASARDVERRLLALADASATSEPRTDERTSRDEDPTANRLLGRAPLRLVVAGLTTVALFTTGIGLVSARNELLALDTRVENHWQQVETQLERQRELLPELSALLDRYIEYEREGNERLIEALKPAPGGDRPSSLVRSADELEQILLTSMQFAEQTPGLRANAQFRALAYEISGTRNRIAVERGRYDDAVAHLNQRLGQYPWKIVAASIRPGLYYQSRSSRPRSNIRVVRSDLDS